MYWRIWDLCDPTNLVASMVAELDDTLPRFTDDRRDSVQVTHVLHMEDDTRVM
jgi:hypothetical protein